jgi:cellulose synthase/poly-beta-1,6-N-acetylglucosamine synthase-like glycosyltransferase
MTILSIILLLLALSYSAFILWCAIGFSKTKRFIDNTISENTFVSVIIAARNEEANIENTLNDLITQHYPSHLFEIIVVDDNSTDNTPALIADIIKQQQSKFSIRLLEPDTTERFHKKAAISKAIQAANGKLVITTDADCRRSTLWLPSIVSYFEKHDADMLCAPVAFYHEKNFFQRIQSLEFCGLIAIAAGSIANRKPMLCNGANLAFTKSVFEKVNGYSSAKGYATGDDTELLQKVAAMNAAGIHFLKSREATVYTRPASSLPELLQQRKRWASKIPLHMSRFTLLNAGIAFFLHLTLLLTFLASLALPSLIYSFLIAILIKTFSEFILLFSATRFLQKQNLLWLLLPAEFLYIFYILIVGILAPFSPYRWKGRVVNG